MEYITSRGHELPKTASKFEADLRFHLWQNKLWPYEELVLGDILYWYETPSQSIVIKSRVVEVDRFPYNSKQEVRQKLVARFHDFDETQEYFVKGPDHGYCLAFKVKVLGQINLPKPEGTKFPQQGWMKIDNDIAIRWLSQREQENDVTLDDLAPEGSLIEKIHNLNISMEEVSQKRVASIVSHTIRQDTQIVKALKSLCNFECQFPNCDALIPKSSGGFYIEVAHVQPVSKGGRSVIGNLLVLCPNHHKEFDHGKLEIENQTEISIQGTLNGKSFLILFPGTSNHSHQT